MTFREVASPRWIQTPKLIEANFVPVGTIVDIIIIPAYGAAITFPSQPLVGSLALSTSSTFIVIPGDVPMEVHLEANWSQ